ncbi:MAG: glycine cleavage system protein GcvH [Planctomycetia bacterium]|jgi:glycine cleavage system H protein
MAINPESLKYAKTHEWVAVDGDVATIGLSSFALAALTDLVFLELPAVGTAVTAGESFGEIESVKAVSDLYSPVDGEIVEVNAELVEKLDDLGEMTYDDAWMIKVKMSDPSQLDALLDYATYQKQCEEEGH